MAQVFEPTVEPKRSCNRHADCAKAEEEVMARFKIERWQISISFHCHDECCEDCFGC